MDELAEDRCRSGGGVGPETDKRCDERRCFPGGECEGWKLSSRIYAVPAAGSSSDGDGDLCIDQTGDVTLHRPVRRSGTFG